MTSHATNCSFARRPRRLVSRLEAATLGLVTAAVDVGPDQLRFGIGRALRNRVLATPLVTVGEDVVALRQLAASPADTLSDRPLVALVTRTLGTGGVEAVVATLARELPRHGVRTVVLCGGGGSTADALRTDGVEVVHAPDLRTAAELVAKLPGDAVAELHNAPDHLIQACADRGLPIVPVIHSTDINLTSDRWDREAGLTELAPAMITVSEKVRTFYTSNLPRPAGSPIMVIPNGVNLSPILPEEIDRARARLACVLQVDLQDAIVFTCLARYDLQKNIPGLVASFLSAAEVRGDLHLIVAGPIEDWLEHALADAIRCSHPAANRIHLLGNSSSRMLLAASDAFLLDSFFEGWPVAATEASVTGLPLIMSDVGGAVELVGSRAERGRVFGNPAASAEGLSLAHIRRARRRVTNQTNRLQLKEAVLEISREINDWRARRIELSRQARSWLSSDVMVDAHARLLGQVAGWTEPAI
jgi:glycosyltransferase involved in cell wall biosynthesis